MFFLVASVWCIYLLGLGLRVALSHATLFAFISTLFVTFRNTAAAGCSQLVPSLGTTAVIHLTPR